MKRVFFSKLAITLFFLVTILLIVPASQAQGQDSESTQELPLSFTQQLKKKVKPMKDLFDEEGQKAFEEQVAAEKRYGESLDTKLGYFQEVNLNSDTHGVWETLPDGSRVWRLGICAKGAEGIGFEIENFYLPGGGKMFIYNKDRSYVSDAIKKANRYNPDDLFVTAVSGEEIYIEYNEKSNSDIVFNIPYIIYRYAPFPHSYAYNNLKPIPDCIEPYTDADLKEMEINAQQEVTRPFRGSFNYSYSFYEKNMTSIKSGVWDTLPNGDRIWRFCLETKSPYVHEISLDIGIKDMPDGAKFFFYSKDGLMVTEERPKHHVFFDNTGVTMFGKNLIVEYYEPKTVKKPTKFVLKGGSSRLFDPKKSQKKTKDCHNPCAPSTICSCPTSYQPDFCPLPMNINNIKKSVVYINENYPCFGNEKCEFNSDFMTDIHPADADGSGALINNKGSLPYILTANHLMKYEKNGNIVEYNIGDDVYFHFYFNYESTMCGKKVSKNEKI